MTGAMMRALKWLDALLDSITMYRLLLYYLIFLVAVAVGLGFTGALHYNPVDIIMSSVFLTAVCWISNKLFGYVFAAPTNVESPFITALILALIITPTHDTNGMAFLAAAGGLAVASKFMLAIGRRHLFNPAAVAVALTAWGAGDSASWWVGTAIMLPFVIAGGLLLVRRLRRLTMVTWFYGAALLTTGVLAASAGADVVSTLQKEFLNSALFFFAYVMLTEPMTSPTTKAKRVWYGVLVGALFAPQVHLGSFYFTPELALLVGNLFTYAVGPRLRVQLRLKRSERISGDSRDFVFEPGRRFGYQPGQYMEFTFQHPGTNSRGARRFFTLASSPTEPDLRLGVKFYQPGSSYKRGLLQLTPQTPIVATQLGGDFTLPKDPRRKLVFIAGGIGVTPFRSMVKYLLDTNQPRPITMLYSARRLEDLVYRDIFDAARTRLGARIYYLISKGSTQPPVYTIPISEDVIRQAVPGLDDHLFYISGPHGMVVSVSEMLRNLGVPGRNIKKDFFSGYA